VLLGCCRLLKARHLRAVLQNALWRPGAASDEYADDGIMMLMMLMMLSAMKSVCVQCT
jgi:hypothetical protein